MYNARGEYLFSTGMHAPIIENNRDQDDYFVVYHPTKMGDNTDQSSRKCSCMVELVESEYAIHTSVEVCNSDSIPLTDAPIVITKEGRVHRLFCRSVAYVELEPQLDE